jgi:hypothetical protein
MVILVMLLPLTLHLEQTKTTDPLVSLSGSIISEKSSFFCNYSEQSVSCCCRQFQRIGLLGSDASKILDILNIKSLPECYILKRWSQEAWSNTIKESHGNIISEDPRFEYRNGHKSLDHKFLGKAS